MRPCTPTPRLNGATLHPKSAKAPKKLKERPASSPPPSSDGVNGKPASTDSQTADSRTGRDQTGRFVKGNLGGPGNPFGRRTAALRQAFSDAVTHDDLKIVAKRLVLQAQNGDVAAAKLLLAYAVGKPVDPVNPDTLDQQEYQIYQQTPTSPQEVHRINNCLPAGLACKLIRILLPANEYQIQGVWLKKIQDDEKKEERREKQKAARAARKAAANDCSTPAAPMAPAEDSSEPAAQARARPDPVSEQQAQNTDSFTPQNEIAPQSCSQPPSPDGANGSRVGCVKRTRVDAPESAREAVQQAPPQPPSSNGENGDSPPPTGSVRDRRTHPRMPPG